MINIILITLTIHLAYIVIFKPSFSSLSCGLFGWLGNDPKVFNRDKFDKLGIYNEKRGEHSCGMTMDGEIFIGVDNSKIYRNFINNHYDVNPETYPTVLGHTRHATYGKHTIDNAHPFGFGFNKKNDGGFEFVGIHNGTLLNHVKLANEFKIDLVSENKKGDKRDKIDSEILMEILFKTKNFKVLNKYNGAAAIMFSFTTNPNVVYCYHGESTAYNGYGKIEEERPLFYFKEGKNSLYISSILESLESIGGTKHTTGTFDYNTVYKITDGDIDNAEKIKISRPLNYQKESSYPITTKKTNSAYTTTRKKYRYNGYSQVEEIDFEEMHSAIILPENSESKQTHIHKEDELIDKNKYGNKVYFNQLRYWRNGHLINGVYMWVPKFGFYFLDTDVKEAKTGFWNYVNKWFFVNDFIHGKLDEIDTSEAYIPFIHDVSTSEIIEPTLYYFYNGVRMKTELDYKACKERKESFWDISALSIASCHPVITINKHRNINDQYIILDQLLYTGIICPLGSDYIYSIERGNCVSRKPVYNKTAEVKRLQDVSKELFKLEHHVDPKEDIIETNNDLLEKDLEEMFMKNYRDFPRYIKRLKEYKGHKKSQDAIEIMEAYLKSASLLIALEIND